MNDVNTAIPNNKESEDEIIRVFNSHHRKLEFEIEVEADRSNNFLDITLYRNNDGWISTKWYQKPTASGRYLDYKGLNPISHKKNVAIAIADRAITFTDAKDRPESLKRVRKLLNENGYLKEFVEEIIRTRVDGFYNGKEMMATGYD